MEDRQAIWNSKMYILYLIRTSTIHSIKQITCLEIFQERLIVIIIKTGDEMKSALDIIYDQARSIQMLQDKVNTLQSELEKVVLQLNIKNTTERSLTCSCRSEKNEKTISHVSNYNQEHINKMNQDLSKIKIEEPENRAEYSIEKKQNKFLTNNSLIDNNLFAEICDSQIYDKEIKSFAQEKIIISPINKNLDMNTPKEKIVRLNFNDIDNNITTTSIDKSSRPIRALGASISHIDGEAYIINTSKNYVIFINFRIMM
jgi:hypothetical protein